jgi:uncharacterized protein (DUF697 family)
MGIFVIRHSNFLCHSAFVIRHYTMDQPGLLNIVEKLESLLGKLPEKIRKPVLRELTPLRQLFLQKRAPRLLFVGSIDKSTPELLEIFFQLHGQQQSSTAALPIFRWQEINACGRGKVAILDARGAQAGGRAELEKELKREPADVIIFLDEGARKRTSRKSEIENLLACLRWNDTADRKTKIVGASFSSHRAKARDKQGASELAARLAAAIPGHSPIETIAFDLRGASSACDGEWMSILTRTLPNETRVELVRITRDREQQRELAQRLVKSTCAICAAIGAQPIPLADLPILTTLQLVMVSGIMYLSGRERSLRAATEFIGAIGANVGLAMLLREGVRAALKFVPGWGNLVCGMVAGAGTYAIGRAATAFFIEGVSLKEARRTYLASRRKPTRATMRLSDRAEISQKAAG